MQIIRATLDDLEILTKLFDEYRQFYKQAGDLPGAKEFLKARLSAGESIVFLAKDQNDGAGFTQLFPTFSSVGLSHTYLLNDLFVANKYRKQGVAQQLMATTESYAKTSGAKKLVLRTAIDNIPAQKLYEKRNWIQEKKSFTYSLTL
jgi:GNAT superfamily N-acetyltransferase